jgi:transcription initiation factor TFIID subunit 5
LSWSVESSVLVSAGADKTVRVWDVLQEITESGGKGTEGAAKTDGALTTKGASGTTVTTKKAAKETGVSADQISAFPTKDSPVYKVHFTRMNLVLAGITVSFYIVIWIGVTWRCWGSYAWKGGPRGFHC